MKKRFVVFISILLAVTFIFAGCGEKICDHCGEKKKVKTYTLSFFGKEEVDQLCQDCYDELLEFSEGFSKLLDKVNQ